MGEISVVARIKAKPGMEKEVFEALTGLVAPTRREEGCICYILHRSTDDPAQFIFYENWIGTEALQRHMESPHFLAWRARAADLLAEPPEVTLWEKVG